LTRGALVDELAAEAIFVIKLNGPGAAWATKDAPGRRWSSTQINTEYNVIKFSSMPWYCLQLVKLDRADWGYGDGLGLICCLLFLLLRLLAGFIAVTLILSAN